MVYSNVSKWMDVCFVLLHKVALNQNRRNLLFIFFQETSKREKIDLLEVKRTQKTTLDLQ